MISERMCLDSSEPPSQLFPNNWRTQKYFPLWRQTPSQTARHQNPMFVEIFRGMIFFPVKAGVIFNWIHTCKSKAAVVFCSDIQQNNLQVQQVPADVHRFEHVPFFANLSATPLYIWPCGGLVLRRKRRRWRYTSNICTR